MTDNKLTDEQIIKALEYCINKGYCPECPCYENNADCKVEYDALDLINRKDKRIEELQLKNSELEIELKAMRGAANSYKAEVERLKDIAKRLKSVLIMCTYQNFDGVIDNLVKRMAGE